MNCHHVPTVSREKDLLVQDILKSGRYRVEPDGTLIDANWRGLGYERPVRGRRCRGGHWLVNLATGRHPRQVTALLSRVVALAIHGDPGKPLGAVHLDGDLDNNHPGNLAWMDLFDGMRLASKDGRLNIYRGTAHKNAKLDEKSVRKFKRMLAHGLTVTAAARKVGILDKASRAALRQVASGVSWRHA